MPAKKTAVRQSAVPHEMIWVRLKPHNPRRGHVLRRYADMVTKMRFVTAPDNKTVWYKFHPRKVYQPSGLTGTQIAEYLATICQNGETQENCDAMGIVSQPAFDVAMSEAEAHEIEARAVANPRLGRAHGTVKDPVEPTSIMRARPGRRIVADDGDLDAARTPDPEDDPMSEAPRDGGRGGKSSKAAPAEEVLADAPKDGGRGGKSSSK